MTTDDNGQGAQGNGLPRRRPGISMQRPCEPWLSGPRIGRQDRTIALPTGIGPPIAQPGGWRRPLYRLGRNRYVRWAAESLWMVALALSAAAVASIISTYILIKSR